MRTLSTVKKEGARQSSFLSTIVGRGWFHLGQLSSGFFPHGGATSAISYNQSTEVMSEEEREDSAGVDQEKIWNSPRPKSW